MQICAGNGFKCEYVREASKSAISPHLNAASDRVEHSLWYLESMCPGDTIFISTCLKVSRAVVGYFFDLNQV